MSFAITAPRLILLGHGSRNEEANAGFVALGERLAERLGVGVSPAFFSISEPGLENVLKNAYAGGERKFAIMPYFLYQGQHVRTDIPELLEQCRRDLPGADITMLPTLENDPAVEDVVLDRLEGLLSYGQLPTGGMEIEERSHAMLDTLLKGVLPGDAREARLVRRLAHASGDLSFARGVRIGKGAVAAGIEAIRAGRNIFVDVKMLAAGITKAADNEVFCGIDDPDLAEQARAKGSTRAAEAVEKYADMWAGGILAVGNAPTALWRLMELCRRGARPPALVVGLPVGFVGAAESKAALWESGLPCITNLGRRGGSPVAAAAVNALALLAGEGDAG